MINMGHGVGGQLNQPANFFPPPPPPVAAQNMNMNNQLPMPPLMSAMKRPHDAVTSEEEETGDLYAKRQRVGDSTSPDSVLGGFHPGGPPPPPPPPAGMC